MTGAAGDDSRGQPCELLSWDSEFFGIRIGRVLGDRLDAGQAQRIEQWRQANHVDCLYFAARSDNAITARTVEDFGYRLVDIRVTLEQTAKAAAGGTTSEARSVRAEDVAALQAIARGSFYDTRFYFDGNFPREKCDALYELWISKACIASLSNAGPRPGPSPEFQGSGNEVLVIERNGMAAGFITCDVSGAGEAIEGSIGLIGVASEQQGKGVGSSLVHAALNWFASRSVWRVSVVTQGRNIAAQRLYQQCGFKTRSVQLYYHRWYLL